MAGCCAKERCWYDVVSRSYFAGIARKISAEQHLWIANSGAASGRGHQSHENKPGAAAVDPRTPRNTPHKSSCSGCHSVIDPLGFALENFDVIGGWRIDEAGKPVDTRSTTTSGATVEGLAGLRALLLENPQQFPTITEN